MKETLVCDSFACKSEKSIANARFLWYNIINRRQQEESQMGVSYKKLFKLLIDRKMKKKDLRQMAGLSSSSITKLAKDEYVSMEVLVKVCATLGVDIGDIMEVVSSQNGEDK